MRSKEQMISLMMRHVLACSRVDVQSNPSRYAEELPPADHPAGHAMASIDSWNVMGIYKSETRIHKTILWQSECHAKKADPTMRDCKVLCLMLGGDFRILQMISTFMKWVNKPPWTRPDGIAGDKFLELFKDRKCELSQQTAKKPQTAYWLRKAKKKERTCGCTLGLTSCLRQDAWNEGLGGGSRHRCCSPRTFFCLTA